MNIEIHGMKITYEIDFWNSLGASRTVIAPITIGVINRKPHVIVLKRALELLEANVNRTSRPYNNEKGTPIKTDDSVRTILINISQRP